MCQTSEMVTRFLNRVPQPGPLFKQLGIQKHTDAKMIPAEECGCSQKIGDMVLFHDANTRWSYCSSRNQAEVSGRLTGTQVTVG